MALAEASETGWFLFLRFFVWLRSIFFASTAADSGNAYVLLGFSEHLGFLAFFDGLENFVFSRWWSRGSVETPASQAKRWPLGVQGWVLGCFF